jgi:hypothetical protein
VLAQVLRADYDLDTSAGIGLMKAPILLAFLGLVTSQAAEPTGTLTLACEGTHTAYRTTEPMELSFNLFLNFATGTVESSAPPLSPFMNICKITQVTPFIVYLKYTAIIRGMLDEAIGTLDRVTGVLEGDARTYKKDTVNSCLEGGYRFSVKCTPTQRMF